MTHAPVLVIAPLALEARALRCGDPDLHVVRCGVGPERARAAALLHRDTRACAVAVAGVCGSLCADLLPGDVVVPDELLALDADGRAEGPGRALAAADLRDLVAASGGRVHGGRLVGVARAVRGAGRAALADTGAVAVDMESPWLADAAGERPFGVLRVVVDGPGHELYHPDIVRRGWRALRRLRETAHCLGTWALRSASPAAGAI